MRGEPERERKKKPQQGAEVQNKNSFGGLQSDSGGRAGRPVGEEGPDYGDVLLGAGEEGGSQAPWARDQAAHQAH